MWLRFIIIFKTISMFLGTLYSVEREEGIYTENISGVGCCERHLFPC